MTESDIVFLDEYCMGVEVMLTTSRALQYLKPRLLTISVEESFGRAVISCCGLTFKASTHSSSRGFEPHCVLLFFTSSRASRVLQSSLGYLLSAMNP